jgi:hypothetical protein
MPEYEGRRQYRRGHYVVSIVPDTTYWYAIVGPDGLTVANEDRLHLSHADALKEAEQKIRNLERAGHPDG